MVRPVLPLASRSAVDSQTQLTRLEWQWGTKYASLELDVEANRIYRASCCCLRLGGPWIPSLVTVREDLLESFDSNRWVLLPTPEMVNKMWDHCTIFLDDEPAIPY